MQCIQSKLCTLHDVWVRNCNPHHGSHECGLAYESWPKVQAWSCWGEEGHKLVGQFNAAL